MGKYMAEEKIKTETLQRKAARFVAVMLSLTLLFTLTMPALLSAADPAFTVGTSGDDTLVGLIYEYSVADENESVYTDPGGNDTLRNVTIRNTGSGSGRAVFKKTTGAYTVSGTLTLQNIQLNVTNGLTLSSDAVIAANGLLSGSSIPISTIDGLGSSPREIVRGITEEQADFFSVDAAYNSYYLNGSLYASTAAASTYRVLFDGNGADLEASPYYKLVSSPKTTIDELPYPPQKAGNIFLGWNTNRDGSGTAFTETTAVAADITVYAQWAVQAAPAFSKNPVNQEKQVGGEAVFTAEATGYPAPTLQWQESTDGSTWKDIDGETDETLTLENLAIDKDGSYYRCVASNRVVPEGVPSSSARLTVTDSTTPTLMADPDAINFGSFIDPVSNVPPITISVSGLNLSNDIDDITSSSITGADAANFSVTKASWTDDKGGTLNIKFTPSGVQSYSAALEITSVGAAPLSIPITAEVLATGTPVLQASRSSVNFGSVLKGTTTPADTLNVSGTNLTGSITYEKSGSDAAAFTVTTGTGWTAANGGQLRITFSPTTAGAYTATLKIKSAGAEDIVIQLTGLGVEAPVSPSLTVTPATVNFGNTYSGAPATENITVTGANLASDLAISITGSDASVFSFNKPSGWDNATGGTLEVIFTPTSTGAKTAILTIKTYGVEDKTVTLSGSGIQSTDPVFLTQPASVTKNAGQSATFTVSVSGTPNPTLQWQKSTNNGEDWEDIDGETGSSYTINSVQEADNGAKFRCVATNPARPSGLLSDAATLTVVYPNITVDHDKLAFGSSNIGLAPALTLTIGGNNLTGNITYTKSGDGASAFTITETSWNAATGGTLTVAFAPTAVQNYKAEITISSEGATTKTVELTGAGTVVLPSFSTQPQSQTKMVGESVTFTAALASGGSEATLKWEKSTDSGKTWTAVADATTGTLTVNNLTTADSGSQYRCVATYTAGSGGTVNSNAATLTVTTDHTITESPAKITGTGKTAVFKITGDVSKVTGLKINNQAKTLEGTGTTSIKIKDGATEIGTMTSGSVVVTFTSAYIDSLSNGTYTVEVLFDDGSATGTFTIARSGSGSTGGNGSNGVNTNDDSNMALWTTLAAVGTAGIVLLVILKARAGKKNTPAK